MDIAALVVRFEEPDLGINWTIELILEPDLPRVIGQHDIGWISNDSFEATAFWP